ncbi:hypothetical protein DL765_000433 [Monosporascus sp. GIB2]|nr:hypothetical protein DL765_000433 [Monosporascus sp. GIB2]
MGAEEEVHVHRGARKVQGPYLYGLKQAGAAWQKKVKGIPAKQGIRPLISDNAIYCNDQSGDVIASYVDDFLRMGPNIQRLRSIANGIAKDVPIKDLRDANWDLGVRIVRSSPIGNVKLN